MQFCCLATRCWHCNTLPYFILTYNICTAVYLWCYNSDRWDKDRKYLHKLWFQSYCVLILMLHTVCSTATAVCGVWSGCGPGQTASMWPLWFRMCWLLSGQRPLLCLGWSHLLQILPCWSLHQEVIAQRRHTMRQVPYFPADVFVWYQLLTPLPTHFYSIIASCPKCHNALRLVYQVSITCTERHESKVLCNVYQHAPDHLTSSFPLFFSLFAFFLSFLSPMSRTFITCLKLLSLSLSLDLPRSHLSRRFRRQDVRHGNAVQLCNGLQIDG